ncbi:hypothetical protein SDC9_144727 [bioreactor metagenome]|uniref:Uncharacterized protein n=1 Tax=bioreactor metagenome TaxID=1076179 RepID=A0A645E9R0_9ZZZZ
MLAFFQIEDNFENDFVRFLKFTMAIGKLKFILRVGFYFAFAGDHHDGFDDFFNFTIVCSSIHIDRSADATRNAACEFQAAQPLR